MRKVLSHKNYSCEANQSKVKKSKPATEPSQKRRRVQSSKWDINIIKIAYLVQVNVLKAFLFVVTEPTRVSNRQLLKQQSAAFTDEPSVRSERDQGGVMLSTCSQSQRQPAVLQEVLPNNNLNSTVSHTGNRSLLDLLDHLTFVYLIYIRL